MLRTFTAELALDRLPRIWRDPLWWLLLVGGLACACVLWGVVNLDAHAATPRGLMNWFGLVVWQPLIEELLFRGLIQGALLRAPRFHLRFGPLSLANVVTSLLFTAIHFVFHPPLWALAVLLPSLIFGWLRERHRSTWPAVLTHVIFNLEFFGAAWLAVSL